MLRHPTDPQGTSPVVVGVHPDEGRLAGNGPGGQLEPVDQLDLQRGEERFGDGVVETRPGPAARLGDTKIGAGGPEGIRGVLRAAVGVKRMSA